MERFSCSENDEVVHGSGEARYHQTVKKMRILLYSWSS